MSHINHFRKLHTTSNFDKLNWSKAPIVNIKINIMFGGSHPLLAMLDFRYLTLDFSTIFFWEILLILTLILKERKEAVIHLPCVWEIEKFNTLKLPQIK